MNVLFVCGQTGLVIWEGGGQKGHKTWMISLA